MNLFEMAINAGGQQARTEGERLMVLSHVTSESLNSFVDTLPVQDADWMRTLMNVGALDLGTTLQNSANQQTACKQWETMASAFVEMVGEGVGREPVGSDSTEPELAEPWVVFYKKPALIEVFDEATERLAQQAPLIRSLLDDRAPKIVNLDGRFTKSNNFLVGTMSLWASMACCLDRPVALKSLVDAFPEAMTAATRLESKALTSLILKNPTNVFNEQSEESRYVSPFLVAMHAGSTACMDVIFAKRAEMGKSIDPPIFSYSNGAQSHLTLSEAGLFIGNAASPRMVMHGMAQVLLADPDALEMVAEKLTADAKSQSDLFTAFAMSGLFHTGDAKRMNSALISAVNHAQNAMPAFLSRMDWDAMAPHFRSDNSPFTMATIGTPRAKPVVLARRDDALMALIGKAKADGQEDLVFHVFTGKLKVGDQPQMMPVTDLSAEGFDRTVIAFLDHGFDARKKHTGMVSSLLEAAEAYKHPTLGAMHAHIARRRAHDLISEIETEPASKVSP